MNWLLHVAHVYGGRYYVSRAGASPTRRISKLLQQSLFRPLGRVRYEIVGQDQVFEQLFTVLNQHSMTHTAAPLVILLCGKSVCICLKRDESNIEIVLTGPSGHGKSFLARRSTSLLIYSYYLLRESNFLTSGISSQRSDAYCKCNNLTIHPRFVGFIFNESLRGMLLFHKVILRGPIICTGVIHEYALSVPDRKRRKAMRGDFGRKKPVFCNSSQETE